MSAKITCGLSASIETYLSLLNNTSTLHCKVLQLTFIDLTKLNTDKVKVKQSPYTPCRRLGGEEV
jgi:hypothetical protein